MATNFRKCKNCDVIFEKQRPLQYLCSMGCSVKYAKKEQEKSKPTKPINKISKKLSKEHKIYKAKRIVFLGENPYCKHIVGACTGIATTIHHKRGRTGELLNDTIHWIGLCIECHSWVETHPKEAKEQGYSEDRL